MEINSIVSTTKKNCLQKYNLDTYTGILGDWQKKFMLFFLSEKWKNNQTINPNKALAPRVLQTKTTE